MNAQDRGGNRQRIESPGIPGSTQRHLYCGSDTGCRGGKCSWRVDDVTSMGGMFREAESFNQPLNDWRVDKLTDVDMMFKWSAFDHWEDLGDSKLRSQGPSAKPCCAIS